MYLFFCYITPLKINNLILNYILFTVFNLFTFFYSKHCWLKKITGNDESYMVFDKDAILKCKNVSPTTF